MIRIDPDETYQGNVRADAEELKGKTLEQRARILKRKGRGYEDIWVELRHLGMTQAFAREIVFGKNWINRK